MNQLHIQTPLIKAARLSQTLQCDIFLKLEALQPSGSFKMRGIGFACVHHVATQGAKRLVTSSGGNAGLALAYSAHKLGVPALVVVPKSTTTRAKTLLLEWGAEVIVQGDSWQEANTWLQERLEPNDAFIHPFDDPLVWQGHATLVAELVQQMPKEKSPPDAIDAIDAIVLSVGGGGLLVGVQQGLLAQQGWEDVPILAVETEGAASFYQSMTTGERVVLEQINTIATTLGAKQVCKQAFELGQKHAITPVLVSDEQATRACLEFLQAERMLVEPACGAALALAYGTENNKIHPTLKDAKSIVFIVCGGSGITLETINQYL